MTNRIDQRFEELRARGQKGVTWLSILSPITWFILFKGQAYIHTHTNYLAWHMPFTFFGFALCGFVLRSSILDIKPGRKRTGDFPHLS